VRTPRTSICVRGGVVAYPDFKKKAYSILKWRKKGTVFLKPTGVTVKSIPSESAKKRRLTGSLVIQLRKSGFRHNVTGEEVSRHKQLPQREFREGTSAFRKGELARAKKRIIYCWGGDLLAGHPEINTPHRRTLRRGKGRGIL